MCLLHDIFILSTIIKLCDPHSQMTSFFFPLISIQILDIINNASLGSWNTQNSYLIFLLQEKEILKKAKE
jgi:hypothetical protein